MERCWEGVGNRPWRGPTWCLAVCALGRPCLVRGSRLSNGPLVAWKRQCSHGRVGRLPGEGGHRGRRQNRRGRFGKDPCRGCSAGYAKGQRWGGRREGTTTSLEKQGCRRCLSWWDSRLAPRWGAWRGHRRLQEDALWKTIHRHRSESKRESPWRNWNQSWWFALHSSPTCKRFVVVV